MVGGLFRILNLAKQPQSPDFLPLTASGIAAGATDLVLVQKFGRSHQNGQSRNFSSVKSKDELSIEHEAERKIGWLLKLIFAGTATAVGYQFFPYMGDNVMQQSVSLLEVKDPLFKRIGASRLARFATNEVNRKKIVEMGGAQQLVNMLEAAKDDKTRKEALKALTALADSDEAADALVRTGAILIIRSSPDSTEDLDITRYKSDLLKRFHDMKRDLSS